MSLISLEKAAVVLKYCLQATFVAGLLLTVFLKDVLALFLPVYFAGDQRYLDIITYILRPCAVLDLIILWELSSIMKTIENKNPFVAQNTRSFRNIGLCSLGTSFFFFLKVFFYPTVLTAVVSYVFLIAGLAGLVFSKVFQQAVGHKNENDLTI